MSNDYNPWADPQPPASQPQSSAPYAQSQSSASHPAQSQSSASYTSEPTSSYAQGTGGSSSYAPATGYNGQQSQAQPAQPLVYGVERTAPGSGNNLGALFDFGFKKFATRSLVKIAYIICFIVAIAAWLAPVLGWFMFGATLSSLGSSGYGSGYGRSSSSDGGGVGILFGILQLLFGWISPLLFLITMRMLFEFFVLNQHQAESLEKLELK